MSPLLPEQAELLLNTVYLPGLNNEHRITKTVIQAIPEDKGDYRPDAISKSAMDLAWHMCVTEMRFLDAIAAGEFEFNPRPMPDSIGNSAELASWYGENFQQRLEKLTSLSPDQLAKVVDFRGMYQMPAVMYAGFLLHHSVHHRGQLSMYLRPMGAKVPSMYGESYDAIEARKAAQQSA